jgi:cell division protein ZapA
MPDVTILIGGKEFTVACREGEESYLRTAAAMLDEEATSLIGQIGQLPDARLLLMAGLMLADRTAAFEERAKAAEAKLAELETGREPGAGAGLPDAAAEALARLAAEAEALAEKAEARVAGQ